MSEAELSAVALLDELDCEWVFVWLALIGCNRGENAEDYIGNSHREEDEKADQDYHGNHPDKVGNKQRQLKIQGGARVLANERTAILEDYVSDQRGQEIEENSADVDERRPQLLIGRVERLHLLVWVDRCWHVFAHRPIKAVGPDD